MVGLIKIWISLIALILLASCVPQTKQTACGANEAFSSVLRSCIPVSREPNTFVDITSYLPASTLSKYKNDSNFINFNITIDNPFAQNYTVEWERNYNGITIPLSPTTPNSFLLAPIELASETGLHIISAKVVSDTGAVLDSHNFSLYITENPKPLFLTTPKNPALYASDYKPAQLPVNFEIDVKNNNAIMSGAQYRVDWTVFRNGTQLPFGSETDYFPTTSPLGSSSPTGMNYPRYVFDPYNIDGIILGNYIVRATLTNLNNEVVDEHTWSVSVTHPELPKINSRNIYAGSTSPTWNTRTRAFHGTAYTASTSYNFLPCTMVGGVCRPINDPMPTAQSDFCVSVTNGEGAYTGDGHFVRVDYYLDGGTNIYTAYTSASDHEVCLTDGGAAVLNSLVFNNTSPNDEQTHTIVARVTDEATGIEYTTANMNPSLGTYPITWNLTVLPQNSPPKVAFGTVTSPDITLTGCTTSGNTRNNCQITSDTDFKVNISLLSDDFYVMNPANEANFDYSLRLYQDGVLIQTCNKSDPGFDSSTDIDGTNGYDCVFNIQSYNASGPIDVATRSYQIQAEISDTGSPILGTPATSQTLVWNIPVGNVIERNTSLAIVPASLSVSDPVTESDSLIFSASISDDERDNFNYTIEYCEDGNTDPCTTYVPLTSGTVTRSSGANPYALSVNYPLTEDFLHRFTHPSLNCHVLPRGGDCTILFRLKVTDMPFQATPMTVVTTTGVTSTITNVNPPPSLNLTVASPVPTTFLNKTAFVGLPLSFSVDNPAFVTDTSAVATEKNIRYQWYVKNEDSVTAYEAIPGATSKSLIWTPSLIKLANIASDNPVSLMVCVEDQPLAVIPTPNPSDSVCTDGDPWQVTVMNNTASVFDLGSMSAPLTPTNLATSGADAGNEMAVWFEEPTTFNTVTSSAAYIAMIGNDKRIYVKKALVKDNGEIDTINASLITSFNAVSSGTTSTVRNLSITGVQGTGVAASDLYIAYAASRTGAPGSLYPQVRRIDLTATPGKIAPHQHRGKFGFDYNGLGLTNNCNPSSSCTFDNSTTPGVVTLDFSHVGSITGDFDLQTPNGDFTFTFAASSDDIDRICQGCDVITMATDFADIINKSTDPLLAGYSADNGGGTSSTVTIYGATPDDFFDASTFSDSRITDQVGKIYVAGGSWHLPFIDKSIGGSYSDKLSVYRGPVSSHMGSSLITLEQASPGNGLEAMPAAVAFDNHYDGTTLWVGLISKSGSAGKLYGVDPASYTVNLSQDVMPFDVALDIQVAGSTPGNVYAGVRVSSGNKLKLGIYSNSLVTLSEFEMDDTTHTDPSSDTEDFFNPTAIGSYRIIPYAGEARVVATSKGGNGSDYQLYLARLRSVSGNWTLSCGACKQISFLEDTVSGVVKIAASKVRVKPVTPTPYRLASDGSVVNEGIRDVVFVGFGGIESANPGRVNPVLGVLNVEPEPMSLADIFIGPTDPDAGLFRPPFIKSN